MSAAKVAPLRKPPAQPASDAELGMVWWNRITPRQRLAALRAADTAVPAVAWEWWQRTSVGCEENAHGRR